MCTLFEINFFHHWTLLLVYFRYIVATQDRELQEKLRTIPGVPLMYLHGKTPTLESASKTSREHAEAMKRSLGMTVWEKENVEILRKEAGIIDKNNGKLKKKKKGGPNPLSCLKKKKKPQPAVSSKTGIKSGKVRKKKKIKIAAHVKEALATELKHKI